jgi:hypothetical protein
MHRGTRRHLVLAAMFAVERGDESPDDRGVLRESFDDPTASSGVAAALRYRVVNHRRIRHGSRITKKEHATRLHGWCCAAVCVRAYPVTMCG